MRSDRRKVAFHMMNCDECRRDIRAGEWYLYTSSGAKGHRVFRSCQSCEAARDVLRLHLVANDREAPRRSLDLAIAAFLLDHPGLTSEIRPANERFFITDPRQVRFA